MKEVMADWEKTHRHEMTVKEFLDKWVPYLPEDKVMTRSEYITNATAERIAAALMDQNMLDVPIHIAVPVIAKGLRLRIVAEPDAEVCGHGVEPESDCLRCHPSPLRF